METCVQLLVLWRKKIITVMLFNSFSENFLNLVFYLLIFFHVLFLISAILCGGDEVRVDKVLCWRACFVKPLYCFISVTFFITKYTHHVLVIVTMVWFGNNCWHQDDDHDGRM